MKELLSPKKEQNRTTLIFINGILKLPTKSSAQFYADDGVFTFSEDSFDKLVDTIKHDLSLIDKWFVDNHMHLNISKTKILLINNHNDDATKHFMGINYEGRLIKREKEIKYLGLTIDEKLTYNEHITRIKNKLSSIGYAIYRMKNILPKKQLWLIYNAHFLSHLAYLNPIWSNCNEQHLNEMQRTQNKIIKSIRGLPRLTPTISLYETNLNIREFNYLQIVTTIQKIKHKNLECNLELNAIGNITRTLRNAVNYRIAFFKKEKFKKSLLSHGLNCYNKMPNSTKNVEDTKTFIKIVRQQIKNKNIQVQ